METLFGVKCMGWMPEPKPNQRGHVDLESR